MTLGILHGATPDHFTLSVTAWMNNYEFKVGDINFSPFTQGFIILLSSIPVDGNGSGITFGEQGCNQGLHSLSQEQS